MREGVHVNVMVYCVRYVLIHRGNLRTEFKLLCDLIGWYI